MAPAQSAQHAVQRGGARSQLDDQQHSTDQGCSQRGSVVGEQFPENCRNSRWECDSLDLRMRQHPCPRYCFVGSWEDRILSYLNSRRRGDAFRRVVQRPLAVLGASAVFASALVLGTGFAGSAQAADQPVVADAIANGYVTSTTDATNAANTLSGRAYIADTGTPPRSAAVSRVCPTARLSTCSGSTPMVLSPRCTQPR